jgi:uncharacterized protein (TIGR03083 family)
MEWLPVLAHEIDVIAHTVRGATGDDLDLPVAGCPGWTCLDLVDHIGSIERWVVHAVRRRELLDDIPGWPGRDLLTWYEEGAATLLLTLATDPTTPAATFAPDKTVGFWQRRQVHEHRIHRWDLEEALGGAESIEPDLAHDGLDEVASMFWPRQVRLGRASMPVEGLRVVTTDTGGEWVFGDSAQATLTGTAADLLLVLLHRQELDRTHLTWSGDEEAGRSVLSLALAP